MLSLKHEQQEQKSEQHQFCKCVKSTIRWQKAVSYFPSKPYRAESFALQVEETCLQHLPTLSLKENEPDGLQIEENLGKSKRHFFALWNELPGPV